MASVPQALLDLEATIEEELKDLQARYWVADILCDPYQLHRSITTLKNAGLPIEEFPQTVGNTTRMGQALFDLLNGRNLAVYPSAERRQQALNTIAIESPRGWRIAKEKTSKKIDAIVALAMACVAALEGKPAEALPVRSLSNQEAQTPEPSAAEVLKAMRIDALRRSFSNED